MARIFYYYLMNKMIRFFKSDKQTTKKNEIVKNFYFTIIISSINQKSDQCMSENTVNIIYDFTMRKKNNKNRIEMKEYIHIKEKKHKTYNMTFLSFFKKKIQIL